VGLRPGLDWCGKSHPTGIRFPDRPALRQSAKKSKVAKWIYTESNRKKNKI